MPTANERYVKFFYTLYFSEDLLVAAKREVGRIDYAQIAIFILAVQVRCREVVELSCPISRIFNTPSVVMEKAEGLGIRAQSLDGFNFKLIKFCLFFFDRGRILY